MLNTVVANVVAGLGLFFSGLRMVDATLRQTAGRQLRGIVSRLTENRVVAGAVGLATGALVQSSSGIVFILVSLVTSGLTTVRRALPIVTWANVGCCALIFVALLDLRLAILYLVGLTGAAYAFDRSHRSEAFTAVFGVGMLFYGIELMKDGTEPLKSLPWFSALLNGEQQSYLLPFVSGAAFSFVTQSSTAVAILAIGFARTGLLGPFPAMMVLYGANVGSTCARMVLTSHLKGSVRQLTAYQDAFKISGAVLFVSLLYLEAGQRIPLVLAFARHLSGRIDRQMATVFLLVNVTMALLFTVLQPAILRLLEAWLPADDREDLSKPEFLYDEALEEPVTALDLIAKEQFRVARRLQTYTEAMRTPAGSPERQAAAVVQRPFASVVARIEQFQHDLANRHLANHEAERLTQLQSRLSLIVYLEDSLRTLTTATDGVAPEGRMGGLVSSVIEGLDFVLMSLLDALETEEEEAVALVVRITGDRGDLVERLRQQYLAGEAGSVAVDRALLLQVTSVFERIIWMIQRLARLIESGHRQLAPAEPAVVMDRAAGTVAGT